MSEADDKAKLRQASENLGLSFLDSLHLIRYRADNPTASYHWNARGDEWIEVGSAVLALDVPDVEMVLRHEFLHRCTYHGFAEKFTDPELLNIAQDVCINRLLYEAYPEKMRHLSQAIYPPESKTTIIALADASADPAALSPKLAELWRWVWSRDASGSFPRLNPTDLYYRLTEYSDANHPDWEKILQILKGMVAAGRSPIFGDGPPYQVPEQYRGALDDILRSMGKNLPPDATFELEGFSAVPLNADVRAVETFLASLKLQRSLQAIKARLETQSEVVRRPYPVFPTYRGLVYQGAGLGRHFGYAGRESTLVRTAPDLDFYFDVSGSMDGYLNLLVHFARRFREFPLRFFAFSGTIREVADADFVAGRFPHGGGTDFDLAVNHFLVGKTEAALFFSDGGGSLEDGVADRLRTSGKSLFLILLVEPGARVGPGDLGTAATQTLIFEVPR